MIPKITPTFEADRSTLALGLRNGFGCGTTELHVLRAGPQLNARYANHVVSSRTFLLEGTASMIGVAGQRRVPESFIENLEVKLPVLDEQQAIADFLDAETARIDSIVSRRESMLRLLETRLVADSYVRTFADWSERTPLRRVVRQVKTGSTPATGDPRWFATRDVMWFSPSDFGDDLTLTSATRRISRDAVTAGEAPIFPANSTLVVGIGATAGKVAHLEQEASANQQVTCIVPTEAIHARFLSWQLWARRTDLRELAPYTTLPILNNEFMRALPTAVPSMAEQLVVIEYLDNQADLRESGVRAIRSQVILLREHRQALITAAVTGEIDVSTASGRGVPA